MIINACAISDIGSFRNKNEDNFYLSDECVDGAQYKKTTLRNAESLICSVCDGMGGEHKGDLASKIAVHVLSQNVSLITEDDHHNINFINRSFLVANDEVFLANTQKNRVMGTTMSVLYIHDNSFIASNVGDTRIYHYSNGYLSQLSHDHTKAQLLMDAGLTVDENSNYNHVLTQYIGIDSNEMIIEPFVTEGKVNNNDYFILCSDGLYDFVTNEEMERILLTYNTADVIAQALVDKAKYNGSNDNITTIVLSVL